MPLVNGRQQYWWNWTARDPKTGRQKTFFTNGFAHVCTREQLFGFARRTFPTLDIRDFTCELTDTMPPNRRDLVPVEYRTQDQWQLWANRRLTGDLHDAGDFIQSGLAEQPIVRPRSILQHGPASHQHQERRPVDAHRGERRVSILRG